MSKGEELIEYFLKKHKVQYVKEKTFSDLRNGKLRFDFYLPLTNTLIEIDGEQHFKFTPHFHKTKRDFTHAKQNDYYKNSYALAHGLQLYRIPYWEIENIRSYQNIFQKKFLVTNKWWNDQIYRQHLTEGNQK